MNVIPPLDITDAMLTSSTLVEVAPSAYNAGTTYAIGNTVSVAGSAGLRAVYESLQNGNTGNTPASSPLWWEYIGDVYQAYSGGATYALGDLVQDNTNHLIYESLVGSNLGNALTDTTKWLEIGPTNKWAMFDTLRNTPASSPVPITVVITPGERIDSVGIVGLIANELEITLTSTLGGGAVFTETIDLNTRDVGNWYQYFFEPFSAQPSVVRFNIPPYTDGVLTITATASSGNVEIGAVVIGMQEYIGAIQYDAESDVLNYSSVTRDFAGGTSSMVQRRNVPRTLQQVFIDKSRVNRIRAFRDAYGGTPVLWSGLDDMDTDGYFEALLILGFYKRFTINVRHPETAVLSLELEEV